MASHLKIRICTWNLGNALPPEDISEWLFGSSQTQPFDVVVVGTQEGKFSHAFSSQSSTTSNSSSLSPTSSLPTANGDEADVRSTATTPPILDLGVASARSIVPPHPKLADQAPPPNEQTESLHSVFLSRTVKFFRNNVKFGSGKKLLSKWFDRNSARSTIYSTAQQSSKRTSEAIIPCAMATNTATKYFKQHTPLPSSSAEPSTDINLQTSDRPIDTIIEKEDPADSNDCNHNMLSKIPPRIIRNSDLPRLSTSMLQHGACTSPHAPPEASPIGVRQSHRLRGMLGQGKRRELSAIQTYDTPSTYSTPKNLFPSTPSSTRLSMQRSTKPSAHLPIQMSTPSAISSYQSIESLISDAMGDRYARVANKQLGEMSISVFVSLENRRKIRNVRVMTKGTGPGGYGNKGAVCISMDISGTSFCFVNSHLPAHDGEKYREGRNSDVRDIMRDFERQLTHPNGATEPFSSRFDHCFWFGDLNYRLKVENTSLPSCLLYTSPSPRDQRGSRMPSSA